MMGIQPLAKNMFTEWTKSACTPGFVDLDAGFGQGLSSYLCCPLRKPPRFDRLYDEGIEFA